MPDKVKMGFNEHGITIPVDRILPTKSIKTVLKGQQKYRRIEASIREVGVIEPLIVYPESNGNGKNNHYILLDGHLRMEILKNLGEKEIFCLVAKDDEGFTYNHYVNRLSPIQEHFMLKKALERGLSEERLSKALNVNMKKISEKKNLLEGVCEESVYLLKDKQIKSTALGYIKKVEPIRQMEMTELMVASNNYTENYARALVLATPSELLVEGEKSKEFESIAPEDIAKMEKEMNSIEQDFKLYKEEHAQNVLHLVLAQGYLKRMLDNAKAVMYLSQNYSDILYEFKKIMEVEAHG